MNTCLSIFVHDGRESTTDDGRESATDEDATSMLFGVFKKNCALQQSSIITHVMYTFQFRTAFDSSVLLYIVAHICTNTSFIRRTGTYMRTYVKA